MDYNQAEKILSSFNLEKHSTVEGTHFTFSKAGKHRIIFERLRPLSKGGAGGYLYAVVLDEYRNKCSKNGHIVLSRIGGETELRDLVDRVIRHFDSIY